jgi:NAD(P)-dependent dehydrogenase (short-subunit alcohol dehydrogenase family)
MSSEQKVAIITGASQGIGAGAVQAYRKLGYAVVANSRHITPSADPLVLSVPGDIADPETGRRLVDQAVERFGRVDTLVNNAGVADMLDAVLTRWKAAVDAHQPEDVAALFALDAIFQGLHPYTVGPAGVAEYYAAQPTGMTAAYTLRETRALSDGLVLGYLTVDFGFSDRATLTVYLSVIIRQDADGWRIVHYQVSRLD